jgi:hypothetical protein
LRAFKNRLKKFDQEKLSLFSLNYGEYQRYGVSRIFEAMDGFRSSMDGFMRFLKYHTFGVILAE